MHIKNQELAQLNFYRGFAALYVLVGHCAHIVGKSLLPLPGPGHAVDFFMLMSGFLMSLNFHERKINEPWNKKSTFIKFYARRFFRIAPLYYFMYIIVALFLARLNTISMIRFDQPVPTTDVVVSTEHYISTVFVHLTFLFGLFPAFAQDNILPDWSISLEMQFYAVFPFLMLLMRKIGRIIPVVAFTAIYIVSEHLFGRYEVSGTLLHFGQPSFLPLKINIFLLGIFLGEAKYYIHQNEELKVLQLMGLTFILSFTSMDPIIIGICFYFIVWLFSMLTISGSFLTSLFITIENRLSTPVTTFFANTSFSVYLLHQVVLYCANAIFVTNETYTGMSPTSRFGLLLCVSLPVIYLTSHFLFKLIEFPFINIGKRFLASVYPARS